MRSMHTRMHKRAHAAFNKSCKKTHYDLIEARSEARDGECKRDGNQQVDHVNDQRVTKAPWPTMAGYLQDMPKRIAATEARDVQSCPEKFHPWCNSAHSIVALMRIPPFGLS